MLKCQICDSEVTENNDSLYDHLCTHIGNIEEEAELEGQTIEEWVRSYFE